MYRLVYLVIFFFFQAEDGIRDVAVTGVQTCALPISRVQTALRAPAPPAQPVLGEVSEGAVEAPADKLQRQLGHRPRRESVTGDQERRDPRRAPLAEPLTNPLPRPAERDLVHERVRHRGLGLRLPPLEVEGLDRPGRLLVAG